MQLRNRNYQLSSFLFLLPSLPLAERRGNAAPQFAFTSRRASLSGRREEGKREGKKKNGDVRSQGRKGSKLCLLFFLHAERHWACKRHFEFHFPPLPFTITRMSYYDLDDILADASPIMTTWNVNAFGLGFLDEHGGSAEEEKVAFLDFLTGFFFPRPPNTNCSFHVHFIWTLVCFT